MPGRLSRVITLLIVVVLTAHETLSLLDSIGASTRRDGGGNMTIAEVDTGTGRQTTSGVTAKEMYEVVMSCLEDNPIVESKWFFKMKCEYPESGAEEHYLELLSITAKYRQYNSHEFSGYSGPWIESLFISEFIDKPLSYFNGLFPLFVQWIENDHATRNSKNTLFDELHAVLRTDVIYVLVSQSNLGIISLADDFPNILMISAGGWGHIPIPLIKGDLPYSPIPEWFSIDAGFFGDEKHGGRAEIFEELDKYVHDFVFRKGKSLRWIEEM